MLLHASDAANAGYAVVISSEDTDVLLISLAFKTFIATPMFIKTTKQSRTTYVDVSKVLQVVGGQVCRAFPGFLAFTGCDSVSAFFGQGKVCDNRPPEDEEEEEQDPFDNLSGSHHQSHVNCVSSVYGI